jgi:large exoprotein involved in heme utilization and adhesion
VEVNNFGTDPNSGLIALPTDITDSSQQIAKTCNSPGGDSRFIITGRGGTPDNPKDLTQSVRFWQDFRSLPSNASANAILNSPQHLIEADNWMQNPHNGTIEILATQIASPTSVLTTHPWPKATCIK